MRTLALLLCVLAVVTPATAQETTPLVEVSGGYSALPEDSWDGQRYWSGWLASGSVTVTRWFGVAAEVGTSYYTERFPIEGRDYRFHSDRVFAGVGPRFVARRRRVSGFGQFLVGVENRFKENLFTVQGGGGVDVWLTRAIGIRGGVDGRGGWYDEETYGSWRLHAGAVLALGSR